MPIYSILCLAVLKSKHKEGDAYVPENQQVTQKNDTGAVAPRLQIYPVYLHIRIKRGDQSHPALVPSFYASGPNFFLIMSLIASLAAFGNSR